MGWSESGLRFVFAGLAQLSAGRLQIEGPGGHAFGEWRAQSVRWRDAGQDIALRGLFVAWSLRDLLRGRLSVDRLEVAGLLVAPAGDATPANLPADLRIPLAVRVKRLALGRVALGKYEANSVLLAEGIEAAFDSDGQTHRLEYLRARLGGRSRCRGDAWRRTPFPDRGEGQT